MKKISLLLLSLLLISGCGIAEESVQDKMLRMAKARSAANKQQAEADAAESTKQPKQPTAEAPTAGGSPSDSTKNMDSNSSDDSESSPSATDKNATPSNDSEKPASGQKRYPPGTIIRRDDDDDNNNRQGSQPAADPEITLIPERTFALSNTGELAAYSGPAETVEIYNTISKSIQFTLENSYLQPTSMLFDRDSTRLLIGGKNGHLKQLSVGAAEHLDRYADDIARKQHQKEPFRAHESAILSIASHADANLLVTGDADGNIKLWNDAQDNNVEFQASGSTVTEHLIQSHDGNSLFGLQVDSLRHWNLKNGAPGLFDQQTWKGNATSLAVSKEGSIVVVGLEDGSICFFTKDESNSVTTGQFRAFPDSVNSIAIDEQAKQIVASSQSGLLNYWNLPISSDLKINLNESPSSLIFNKNQKLAGVITANKNLDLYSITSGQAVRRHTTPTGNLLCSNLDPKGEIVGLLNDQDRIYFQTEDQKNFAYLDFPELQVDSFQTIEASPGQFWFRSKLGKIGFAQFASRSKVRSTAKFSRAVASSSGKSIALISDQQLHLLQTETESSPKTIPLNDLRVSAIHTSGGDVFIGTEQGEIALLPKDLGEIIVKAWAREESRSDRQRYPIVAIADQVQSSEMFLTADQSGNIMLLSEGQSASGEIRFQLLTQSVFTETPVEIVSSGPVLISKSQEMIEIASFEVSDKPEIVIRSFNRTVLPNSIPSAGSQDSTPSAVSASNLTQAAEFHSGSNCLAEVSGDNEIAFTDLNSDNTFSVSLPFSNPTILHWSTSGDSLVVTNGTRIATISKTLQGIEAEFISEKKIKAILVASDGEVWFLNDEQQISSLTLPRIHWHVTETTSPNGNGQETVSSVAANAQKLAHLTQAGILKFYEINSGEEISKTSVDLENPRGLIAIEGTKQFAFISSISDIHLIDDQGNIRKMDFSNPIRLTQILHDPKHNSILTVSQTGVVLGIPLDSESDTVELIAQGESDVLKITSNGELLSLQTVPPSITVINTDAMWRMQTRPSLPASMKARLSTGDDLVVLTDQSGSLIRASVSQPDKRDTLISGAKTIAFDLRRTLLISSPDLANQTDTWKLTLQNLSSNDEPLTTTIPQKPLDLKISDAGNLVAASLSDASIMIFKTSDLTLVDQLIPDEPVVAMSFQPDETGLFVALKDGSIRSLPLLSRGSITTEMSGIVGVEILGGQSSPWILSCSRNGKIKVWDSQDLESPICTLAGTDGAIQKCHLDQNKERLIVTYADAQRKACVWSISQIQPSDTPIDAEATITSSSLIQTVAVAQNGDFLFGGLEKGGVACWRLSDSKQTAVFSGQRSTVEKLTVTPENILVSYGGDNQVHGLDMTGTVLVSPSGLRRETMKPVMLQTDLKRDSGEDNEEPITQTLARRSLNEQLGPVTAIQALTDDETLKSQAAIVTNNLLEALKQANPDAIAISNFRRQLAERRRSLVSYSSIAQGAGDASNHFTNQLFESETNYFFEQDETNRSIVLQFDGDRLHAARSATNQQRTNRPSMNQAQLGMKGKMQTWDYAYTGLQLRDWALDPFEVQSIIPSSDQTNLITSPTTTTFRQDGIAEGFIKATAWDWNSQQSFFARGLASGYRNESQVLQVFDLNQKTKQPLQNPIWTHQAYDGVVTAVAFANQSMNIAFAIRGPKSHQIYIANPTLNSLHQVEEFSHDVEWIQGQQHTEQDSTLAQVVSTSATASRAATRSNRPNQDADKGIDSLIFSPDDKVLVSHGKYGKEGYRLNRWDIKWEDESKVNLTRKSVKELSDPKEPVLSNHMKRSIWFIRTNAKNTTEQNPESPSIYQGTQYRILAMRPDRFSIINMNSAKEEEAIEFPATRRAYPNHDVSSDGRWLLLGDSSGRCFVWDLATRRKYSIAIDAETERLLETEQQTLEPSLDRPAHTGPIAGVTLSEPDPGQDYPALAATVGEENRIKVWELFPILDSNHGLRSRRFIRYPVSVQNQ